jgi:serine/threonine protein kinase
MQHLSVFLLITFILTLSAFMASFEHTAQKVTGFRDFSYLAKGAYGKVFKARDGDAHVAVKVLSVRGERNETLKCYLNEIMVHRYLAGGAHVVEYITTFFDTTHIWIVLKLYPGSLRNLLDRCGSLAAVEARRLAFDLVQGVAYMHGKGLVHCDLKPENVLLDADGSAKLADFGLTMPEHMAQRGDHIVSRFYRAPEVACLLPWGYPVDLWSLGCIFFELFALVGEGVKQPNYLFVSQGSALSDFEGGFELTDLRVVLKVCGTIEPPYAALSSPFASVTQRGLCLEWRDLPVAEGELPDRYLRGCTAPDAAKTLVARLLRVDPARRLTATEALRVPYFEGLAVTEVAPSPMSKSEAEKFEKVFGMEAAPCSEKAAKRYKIDPEQVLQEKLIDLLTELTHV